ncbi:MAG: glycosyltransferase [Gemmatimonadota bacterium]|nr:glycosyltransferase [Gemmatimonadota bacterium]
MTLGPLIGALPWWVIAVGALVRGRRSRSLDDESPVPPADAPLVSVIVPARNEAGTIGRCVRSILGTKYPAMELIVVDDRSEDDTARIVREMAGHDPRLRLIEAGPFPPDWFGKQWACRQGASVARGSILCFADADTWHEPDLLTRSVNAMHRRGADLLSLAGRQELGSFWERVVQPQVFSLLAVRYGGTEVVNDSPRATDKIANGQCMLFGRAAYDEIGGHGAVRQKVAEDLALAQLAFRRGRVLQLVLAQRQLSTRMYTSLRDIVQGWMKNVYAGTLDAAPLGALGRTAMPLLLPLPLVMTIVPVLVLLVGPLTGASGCLLLWAALCTAAMLVWLVPLYLFFLELPLWYVVFFPLGATVLLYIVVRSTLRGRRVVWKGREYRAG